MLHLWLLQQIDDAAALGRTAAAGHLFDVSGKAIIECQFLAALDRAFAHIEDVAAGIPGAEVGVATVIDDLSAAAAHGTIECPVIVEREEIGDGAVAAALGLFAADAFAGVLNHFAVGRNTLPGIDSTPVNLRFPNGELELRVTRVDGWFLDENGSHVYLWFNKLYRRNGLWRNFFEKIGSADQKYQSAA